MLNQCFCACAILKWSDWVQLHFATSPGCSPMCGTLTVEWRKTVPIRLTWKASLCECCTYNVPPLNQYFCACAILTLIYSAKCLNVVPNRSCTQCCCSKCFVKMWFEIFGNGQTTLFRFAKLAVLAVFIVWAMDLSVIVTPANIGAKLKVAHVHQLVTPSTVRHIWLIPM